MNKVMNMNKEDVLKLEEELSFDHFDAEDAYCIGNEIVKKTSKPVRIRIVLDGDIVFQYLMPGKKGVEWLDRKQNTVERYHHSTYYVFLDQEERHVYDENDSTIAICGGGFPLFIKGELRGCVIVSGLAHDEDHQLIINTLRRYKNESFCE